MAVAYSSVSPDTSASSVTSLTSGTFTVSGSDRGLIGFISTGDGSPATHSVMKWAGSGGTSLTQIGSTLDVGTLFKLSTWGLLGPNATTDTIYGDWTPSQVGAIIGGVNYTGVDSFGTPATATGTVDGTGAGTATVNVTTVSGDMVFAVAMIGNNNSSTNPQMTPAGGSTGRYEVEGAAVGFMACQAIELVATGTTTTMSVDITSGEAGQAWGIIAFIINAAAAASPAAEIFVKPGPVRPRPFAPGNAR